MKSPVIQFGLGAFTAIALVVVALYLGLIPGLSNPVYSGPTLVAETSSADGQYVARSERKSNSGDWCEERTTIDRAGSRSDWGREYVFMNACGMPVEIAWIGERALRISYGYNGGGKAHVYREAFSKDKQVMIDYQLVEGGTR